MTAAIQDKMSIRKDDVLRVIDQYSLRTVELSIAQFYLSKSGVDLSESGYLRELIKPAVDDNSEDIVDTIFGKEKENISINSILRVFELAVEEDRRDINGVYYTPEEVVNYIIEESVTGDDRVCDCASGAGAFLVRATEKIYELTGKSIKEVIRENIYGVDILENNVRETKIVLALLAAQNGEIVDKEDFNVIQADSLKFDWEDAFPSIAENGGFDAIVGNPPYVNIQTMDVETKDYVLNNYETVKSGNFNTYIPFIELGLKMVNEKGTVGYILPLNYFTTLTGESLREFLQKGKYISKIVDFGDTLLFDDALTYTAISLFTKKSKSSFDYIQVDNTSRLVDLGESEFIDIKYSSIEPEKWRLLDEEEFENIRKIESFRPLDEIAGIHTGVATLKDEVYIVEDSGTDSDYYTKQYNGEDYKVEKEITEELVKISTIEGLSDLQDNSKRIIVPYKKHVQRTLQGNGKEIECEIIPEEELRSEYPHTYEYLEAAKEELATREKGGGADYSPWYKYGREQGLEYVGERLYTPTYSNGPKFLHHKKEYALFSNGYAVFPEDEEIEVLEKVLNSKIMDYYIRQTSKEIQGDYQCYQKNFIRRFSVPEFSESERERILSASTQSDIDEFLVKKYDLNLEISN